MRERFFVSALVALLLAALATQAVAQTGERTYTDDHTGLSFRAPAGLIVTSSELGVGGRTSQAVFATYRGATNPKTQVDIRRELVITAYVASRTPNEDLRAWVARNAEGSSYRITALPRANGILLEGLFQAGARKYALFERGPEGVLVVDAYPTFSSRIGLFDGLLASLEVR